MKKLFILSIFAILISGCTCIMSQSIPPQYLYVGEDCGAALPDYLPKFTFTDNCAIDTVWQSPTRGSWLTVPTTTVLIRAIDNFNNHTDLMFNVTLVDTVPPVITLADSSLISNVYEKIDAIYNIADRMLAETDLWTTAQFSDTIPIWEDYYNNVLVSYTDPGHAFTGEGMRVWVFGEVGDTIIIK
jgi:hypothetical protein